MDQGGTVRDIPSSDLYNGLNNIQYNLAKEKGIKFQSQAYNEWDPFALSSSN